MITASKNTIESFFNDKLIFLYPAWKKKSHVIPIRNLHTIYVCPRSPATRRRITSLRTGAELGPLLPAPRSLGRGQAGTSSLFQATTAKTSMQPLIQRGDCHRTARKMWLRKHVKVKK